MITKAMIDALYRAIIYAGGNIERLQRAPSHKSRVALRAAGLSEWHGDYECHVTQSGYETVMNYYGSDGMKRAQLAQKWRNLHPPPEE